MLVHLQVWLEQHTKRVYNCSHKHLSVHPYANQLDLNICPSIKQLCIQMSKITQSLTQWSLQFIFKNHARLSNMNSDVCKNHQYTLFTVFFTLVCLFTLPKVTVKNIIVKILLSQDSDFLCSTATFLNKIAHGGLYEWLFWEFNSELREVSAGFLRETPGASVIQWDGGFLPNWGEWMDEIRSSQLGPQETRPAARCAICSLVLFVYLSPLFLSQPYCPS